MKNEEKKNASDNKKHQDLERNREDSKDQFLTTNQGLKINDDQNSLKAGDRGASLLEDFILREKITHFDHERIPERIVHARGSAAHGYFQVYESMEKYTKAGFLQDPSKKTPVFTRFSTVAGFKGSTDLARDVRGFSVKFYTEEGNYDLVGNNIPVFFIQDAIKFPDLIHAVKPEPHNEIPQAASAHDTFWDFISLMPESTHMIMWAMSDRAIPRSLRMMEGFGVHTFRFVNKENKGTFVKFHWKPLLGTHGVAWDEAQKISGNDPDFHRRDLWNAIDNGQFPEWELGVQIIPEEDEHKFDFDLLDATKLVPEELVPVKKIGKMVLNRNPDNFFAETEQVAFHPGHIVPGIDFTNDPLLQGRLFSYTDTQLKRLGGPNFHEIPINRPIAPMHNNQRDGHMRQEINKGQTSYHPNSLRGGCPFQAKIAEGGFDSYPEKIDAKKVRERSKSFKDHFSQATLFFNSQTGVEQQHIIDALSFELGKVGVAQVQERMLGLLNEVSNDLAQKVASNLGMKVPERKEQLNHGVPADFDPERYEPTKSSPSIEKDPALSMMHKGFGNIATRQVAFLCADGVDDNSVDEMKKALKNEGAMVKILGPNSTDVKTAGGKSLKVDEAYRTTASVVYDAFYVPSGDKAHKAMRMIPKAIHFLNEGYKHCKPIASAQENGLVEETYFWKNLNKQNLAEDGVIIGKGKSSEFIEAIGKHRFWKREEKDSIPA
ncbi:catalase [Salegentibacter sp. JZCK2]|uniref:catalase n=1 Tax=Salegentibacter tibetensis TaxID=2873600 RepID=UPI001CCF9A82|nr:catalase [Salegentibacter tibetensis]MBZ9729287.1 catalase [Salegentibacter tibetensis]